MKALLTMAILIVGCSTFGFAAMANGTPESCRDKVTSYAIHAKPDRGLIYRSTDEPWLLNPNYMVHFNNQGNNVDATITVDPGCRILNVDWNNSVSDDCKSGMSRDCSCCNYGCIDCS